MPLDTGHLPLAAHGGASTQHDFLEAFAPTLDQGAHVGEALKAAREYRGLSLDRLAEITKVRASYLKAIEEMRLGDLPSRPFTTGYIRAYARALGMDGDLAAARFRSDGPVQDARLPEPMGVQAAPNGRVGLVFGIGLVLIAAIVLWNVVQRMLPDAPHAAAGSAVVAERDAPDTAPSSNAAPGGAAVSLGAPLPAPVESTTPTPYETPGLAGSVESGGSADASIAASKLAKQDAAVVAPVLPPTGPFKPNGQVFGAPADASVVTLQARKPTSIIVRSADEQVYFARQLAAGEAYRVPAVSGLVIDAPMAETLDVYVGGQGKSILPAGVTSVGKLVGG